VGELQVGRSPSYMACTAHGERIKAPRKQIELAVQPSFCSVLCTLQWSLSLLLSTLKPRHCITDTFLCQMSCCLWLFAARLARCSGRESTAFKSKPDTDSLTLFYVTFHDVCCNLQYALLTAVVTEPAAVDCQSRTLPHWHSLMPLAMLSGVCCSTPCPLQWSLTQLLSIV
jgi:hypothetical protein